MNSLPRVGTTSARRVRGIVGGEQQEQLGLQRIGILEFVDEEVREALLKRRAHGGVIANQIPRPQQQIEEVERAEPRLRGLVAIDRSRSSPCSSAARSASAARWNASSARPAPRAQPTPRRAARPC